MYVPTQRSCEVIGDVKSTTLSWVPVVVDGPSVVTAARIALAFC